MVYQASSCGSSPQMKIKTTWNPTFENWYKRLEQNKTKMKFFFKHLHCSGNIFPFPENFSGKCFRNNNIVPETFWKVVCGKHLWYIIYENKIFVCSGTLSLYGINIFGITLLDILKLAHGIWIRNPYVSMYPEYTFVQKISPLFECNFILKTSTNLCVLSKSFY